MNYKFWLRLLQSYCKKTAVSKVILLLGTGGYELIFLIFIDLMEITRSIKL